MDIGRPLTCPCMQGMVVTALMFTLITLPLSGYGADRGMPLLWTAASVAVVGTGAVFGAQAVFGLDPFNLAATWVMQVGAWCWVYLGAEGRAGLLSLPSGLGACWLPAGCPCLRASHQQLGARACGPATSWVPVPAGLHRLWIHHRWLTTRRRLLARARDDRSSKSPHLLCTQAVVLALLGLMQAVIPAACTRLYPAIARTRCAPAPPAAAHPDLARWHAGRAHPAGRHRHPPPPTTPIPSHAFLCLCSGYSLAHNLAFGVLGGLTPMVITAIDADLGKSGGDTLTYAPAWWILAGCAATVLASLAIRWYAPHCNYTQTQWERRQEADDTATGEQGRAKGDVLLVFAAVDESGLRGISGIGRAGMAVE